MQIKHWRGTVSEIKEFDCKDEQYACANCPHYVGSCSLSL
jgi:hypothetical protein